MILINVGLVNMLPVGPLDGGKFTDTVLKTLKIKKAKEIGTAITAACIIILGLNLLLSFLRFGLARV
jgi:membrane-associated protease RseP (regulator of RpoE activity)